MAEVLFPRRMRCRACRGALGTKAIDPVYAGLYCSPRCAGIPEPARSPEEAPRECRTQRDGKWAWKRRYRCEAEIPDRIREDPSTSWYTCSHCLHLHVGHTRMGEAEEFVMVGDRAALAQVLVKLRGRATHKDVAAVAGIRPIRLKELESPSGPFDVDALFAVLAAYRTRLGFGLPVGRR